MRGFEDIGSKGHFSAKKGVWGKKLLWRQTRTFLNPHFLHSSRCSFVQKHRLHHHLGVGGMMDYPRKLLAPLFLDVILGPKCSLKRIFEKIIFWGLHTKNWFRAPKCWKLASEYDTTCYATLPLGRMLDITEQFCHF